MSLWQVVASACTCPGPPRYSPSCLPCATFPHPVTHGERNQNSLELWWGLVKLEYRFAWVERKGLERLQSARVLSAWIEGMCGWAATLERADSNQQRRQWLDAVSSTHSSTTFSITSKIMTPRGHTFPQAQIHPVKAPPSCGLGLARGGTREGFCVCESLYRTGCVWGWGSSWLGEQLCATLVPGCTSLADRTGCTATVLEPCGHLHSPRPMALHVLRKMQLGGQ